jgi:GNAT superfamily N-acetyltransferase/ribosomal protein S18 acetylase RimI-like enzyme
LGLVTRQLDSANRRDIRAFVFLPFKIYREIPQWVPPLMPGEWTRFRRDKFAFYRHSEAAFFLAEDEKGRPVGRVAVMEHRPHNEYRGVRHALLYLYEAIDDDEVAAALFDAAAEWAAGRGLDTLVGPKGFLSGDGLGLLVEGFEHRPAMGVPYNPAYYVRQWEAVGGFTKTVDFLSAYSHKDWFIYPERLGAIVEKLKKRRRFEIARVRTKRELRALALAIQKAYNSAFVNVWAYTPIPDEELAAVTDKLIALADPRLITVVMRDGAIVGFQFCYPDVSAAIQHTGGQLWPFGWAALMLEQRRTNWLNANGGAILPEYQGLGANAIMYDNLLRTLEANPRYEYVDVVQTQEDNFRMVSDLESLGLRFHKRHRVYSKAI